MTNGEKFKEVFKISQVDEGELYVYAWLPTHDAVEISLDWWDAEYEEPTSKNNLGVEVPYLMHKEMDIPISECQKAYDIAMDYLRSQGKLKG